MSAPTVINFCKRCRHAFKTSRLADKLCPGCNTLKRAALPKKKSSPTASLKLYEVHIFWSKNQFQPSHRVLVLELDKQAHRAGRIALEKVGIDPNDDLPAPQVEITEITEFERGDVLASEIL